MNTFTPEQEARVREKETTLTHDIVIPVGTPAGRRRVAAVALVVGGLMLGGAASAGGLLAPCNPIDQQHGQHNSDAYVGGDDGLFGAMLQQVRQFARKTKCPGNDRADQEADAADDHGNGGNLVPLATLFRSERDERQKCAERAENDGCHPVILTLASREST